MYYIFPKKKEVEEVKSLTYNFGNKKGKIWMIDGMKMPEYLKTSQVIFVIISLLCWNYFIKQHQ